MTLSRKAVARSKQLVAINSSSSLSAILRSAVLICNDVYYDEPVGIFFVILGIFLIIFGGSRRLVGDKLRTYWRQVRGEVTGKLPTSRVVSCRDGVV